jgi:hypothetical protein
LAIPQQILDTQGFVLKILAEALRRSSAWQIFSPFAQIFGNLALQFP